LIIDIGLEVYSAVASKSPLNKRVTYSRGHTGFVPPYALQEILAALAEGSPEAKKTAYLWAAATFVANLSVAQAKLVRNWHTRRCYERTRGQLFCALHYKALKREEASGQVAKGDDEGKAELGKIVNLMQYAIHDSPKAFPDWPILPLEVTHTQLPSGFGTLPACSPHPYDYPLLWSSCGSRSSTLRRRYCELSVR
jgi:hypothetical protein